MDQSKRSFRIVMTMLVSLGTLILIFDLYEIVAGRVDLNRHLPLMLPAVIFALTYIFYRTELIYDELDARRKNAASKSKRDQDRAA